MPIFPEHPSTELAPPSIELVHEDEVRQWFDDLARALTSGDAKAIAALWELPSVVLSDQGARIVQTPAEVEQFFATAKRMYTARGIVDTRPDLQYVEWLTNRIVVADVRWPLFDELHRELGAEASTYTLARDHTGVLRMRVVVLRGESESAAH